MGTTRVRHNSTSLSPRQCGPKWFCLFYFAAGRYEYSINSHVHITVDALHSVTCKNSYNCPWKPSRLQKHQSFESAVINLDCRLIDSHSNFQAQQTNNKFSPFFDPLTCFVRITSPASFCVLVLVRWPLPDGYCVPRGTPMDNRHPLFTQSIYKRSSA